MKYLKHRIHILRTLDWLKQLAGEKRVTGGGIASYSYLSKPSVYRYLSQLVEDGEIEFVSETYKNTFCNSYSITDRGRTTMKIYSNMKV